MSGTCLAALQMALYSPPPVTSQATMSIAERRDLGGSLNNLTIYTRCEGNDGEEEARFKEKKGLLRRAFSSRKKKKKKVCGRSPSPSPGYLTPHSPNCLTPNMYTCPKQPLRQVRSNPYDGGPHFLFDSSPASDLAARRGVFSRRHYGSVELLISSDTDGSGATTAGRFRVETGDREGEEVSSPVSTPVHLENPESQTRWYFKYFLGKLHQNYVGSDAEKEPFLLSVVVTDANNHNVPQYRAILWKRKGAEKRCLSYNPNKPMTVKGILSHFDLEKMEKGPKEIFNPEIQKELLVLEEQEGSVNFKFGVLYSNEGQTSDDEMYSTENGSPEFYRFCSLLGDRVRLKGWEKYRGGLDTKSDMTGRESYYTVYEGHEIMFHVSTLLPYSRENKQQVERKRHIGNDIVNIVYVECDPNQVPSFKPSMMKTHFTHIYAVVTYNKDTDNYRLWVYSEEAVRLFGPPLPCPAVWSDHFDFRDFLLVKLINGEKAAFNTPVFAQKRQRTLEMLIKSIYQDHMPESSKNNMLNRRAFSDIIPENVHGSRRKEEARQSEFLRVGQWLKLKTILKGDAPTSLISSGALLKYQPWEPQCFLHDFSYEIICGDSWGDKLLVATTAGTFVLEEAAQPRMIFDRSVAIKQINVVEAHGLLIFRAEKGKDGKLYVFRLTDFEGEQNEDVIRNKQDCREHKIDKAKGCHLYAISRPGGSHLRLVASLGKRLLVMMWKHSSAWSAWCPVSDNDTVDGFQFMREEKECGSRQNTCNDKKSFKELQAFEVPQLMTLVDGPRGDNQICIGYKNQFDLINEKNGDTLQLYQVDSSKSHLVSAIDIYEDDEPELLLCYNHVCHFQKMSEESSQEFDFQWNSEPDSIVCAFPYIMAFTSDTVEIRLIINGSLVHTMTLPHLSLITSKCDIYFASSAAVKHCNTLGVTSDRRSDLSPHSPPSSPSAFSPQPGSLNIYKIPLMCLVGPIAADKGLVPTASPQPRPQTLLSPLVNTGGADPNTRPRSPSCGRRSPLLRTKKLGPMSYIPSEESRLRLSSNSSSCDSGIHIHRASEGTTPPVSPFFSVSTSLEEEETLIL